MSGAVDLEGPRTPVERVLAQAWEEVLGIEPIGREDRFADLGGTSLAAEKVLTIVRRRLAIDVGAEVLIGTPTLAEIAARLERSRRLGFARRAPAHRRLTDPGRGTPLHCFAGAGAGTVSFLGIAQHMGHERPVIGYQAHGLETRALPSWSVAAHARRHLRGVLSEQPNGPYTLIGHSFGGHIAEAVAQLLRARGERVSGVVLLDTVAAAVGTRSVADYRSAAPAAVPPLAQRMRTHARIALAGIVRFDAATQQEVFWEQSIRVQNRHRTMPLGSRSVVFVTEENAGQADQWLRRARDPAHVHRIGGSHTGLLTDPAALASVSEQIAILEAKEPV